MGNIAVNEYYEIRLASLVSNVDKDFIIELYQPLIGAVASITYLTLVKQKRNEENEDIYSLESLLNMMQIASNQFTSARRALEAVGLMKTYETVKGDIHSYIYELFAPKTPRDFFDDILFRGLLIQYVGEKETRRLASSYEINTNIDKDVYQDVSASFVEVFNPDYDSVAFDKELGDNIVGHRSKKVKSDIDITEVFKVVEENSQIKKEALLEYANSIKQLATLFGLDATKMGHVVIDAYNPDVNPHYNEKVAYNLARDKAKTKVSKSPKVMYTKSDVNSDTDIANYIKAAENTAPVVFLESRQGGTKATISDMSVLKMLSVEQGLPYGIVNIIIDFTLAKKNNILDRFFAEKCATGILREGITNTIDAMNYLNKAFTKKSRTSKATTSTTYVAPKKESAPEVVEKNKEKEDNNEVSEEDKQAILDFFN